MMRYLKLTLGPAERAIHPVDGVIAGHPGVGREALLHVDARADGTTVLLYRLTGDRAALADELRDRPSVHSQEVADIDEEEFHAFVRVAATERGGELVEIAHRHALFIDTPLEYVHDGIRATLVGTPENLRRVLEAIPDAIDFSVENAGQYASGDRDLLSPLTDRQLDVFRTAVEEGYYDVPQRATHEDIAAALDCAPSTVDEHLRKAESRVVSRLLQ